MKKPIRFSAYPRFASQRRPLGLVMMMMLAFQLILHIDSGEALAQSTSSSSSSTQTQRPLTPQEVAAEAKKTETAAALKKAQEFAAMLDKEAKELCEKAKKISKKKKKKRKKAKKKCKNATAKAMEAHSKIKGLEIEANNAAYVSQLLATFHQDRISDKKSEMLEDLREGRTDLVADAENGCLSVTEFAALKADAISDAQEDINDAKDDIKPEVFDAATLSEAERELSSIRAVERNPGASCSGSSSSSSSSSSSVSNSGNNVGVF